VLELANRTVLSHLCGWRGDRDSNFRCRECGRQFQSEGPT